MTAWRYYLTTSARPFSYSSRLAASRRLRVKLEAVLRPLLTLSGSCTYPCQWALACLCQPGCFFPDYGRPPQRQFSITPYRNHRASPLCLVLHSSIGWWDYGRCDSLSLDARPSRVKVRASHIVVFTHLSTSIAGALQYILGARSEPCAGSLHRNVHHCHAYHLCAYACSREAYDHTFRTRECLRKCWLHRSSILMVIVRLVLASHSSLVTC